MIIYFTKEQDTGCGISPDKVMNYSGSNSIKFIENIVDEFGNVLVTDDEIRQLDYGPNLIFGWNTLINEIEIRTRYPVRNNRGFRIGLTDSCPDPLIYKLHDELLKKVKQNNTDTEDDIENV